MEFDDGVTSCGVALFKTVEALSRGAFFFSTSVELKTKGAGGGGAGREMMDSNISLPEILTPKHFLAVSAICLIDRILPVLVFQANFWYTVVAERFVGPRLLPGIQFVGCKIKCVVGGWW